MDKAKVQNSEMLDILQQAVTTELTVSQHYWGRAAFWKGHGIPKLAAMYDKEATEERGHGQLVADRMIFLGKEPSIQPHNVDPTAGSLKTQFSEDLTGEVEVADRYTKWVKTALDKSDFVTMDILKKILLETEEHVDWLQNQLEIMDWMGEENYLQTWVENA